MGIFNREKKNTLTFTINDMHCENCEKKVRGLVEALPGVADVQPNSKKHSLKVTLADGAETNEAAIRTQLETGGYPAT